MSLETIQLECVSWQNFDAVFSLYLICNADEQGRCTPIRIGRGRFATVAAASANPDPTKPSELFALKFLSRDPESAAFSRNARARFFLELAQSTGVRGRANVVQVRGSSRIFADVAEYAYENVSEQIKLREELAFETSHPKATKGIEQTAATNAARLSQLHHRLHDDFLNQVQGDFFVMPAEEGSLEDFLIDWRPWHERKIFQIQPERKLQLEDEISKQKSTVEKFLLAIQEADARRRVHASDGARVRPNRAGASSSKDWPEDCSGLTVLNFIGNYVPSVKTRIVLKLVDKLVEGVSTLHSKHPLSASGVQSGPSLPLAHRDLKLGNYLFSVIGREIVLGDLGFVAPSSIGGTMGSSLAETGMQALGSRLFRAPEQRDALPAPDLRFRVLAKDRIGFFGSGHVKIEPGDQLEVPDLTFGESRDHRVSIFEVKQPDAHRTEARLIDPIDGFREEMKSEDYLAFLMKPSGQYTDIFAIGCTLYYLASGGKNPEDFYDSCLKISIGNEVSQSCLSLALSLCADDAATINRDARGSGPADDEERRRWMEGEFKRTASVVRQELVHNPAQRTVNRFRKPDRVDRLVEYWRNSPQVQNFLRDVGDHPIPFPIVYEVVRCMVRDKEDSYVTRGADSEKLPLQQIDCSKITTGISQRLQQILRHSESAKPNIGEYWAGEELDLFYVTRLCVQERGPLAGGRSVPATDRIEVPESPPAPAASKPPLSGARTLEVKPIDPPKD